MPLPKTQKIFMSNATLADDAQASGTIQFARSSALALQALPCQSRDFSKQVYVFIDVLVLLLRADSGQR